MELMARGSRRIFELKFCDDIKFSKDYQNYSFAMNHKEGRSLQGNHM